MARGPYYAVKASETEDGQPKYPITNCSDAHDAWKLRAHGDYQISQETLEERIQSRARDMDCDEIPGVDQDSEDE